MWPSCRTMTCNLEPVIEGPPTSRSLQDILHAITTSREALEMKTNTLGADLGVLKGDRRQLAESPQQGEN
ncbi:hypothetical protein NDU88_008089 [Pleurodeles waltl]|uniref:Uncharacterized protein n=1 Tax=Pleurodeles waltl TaxID=8319 RepID=A0AAV7RVW4_PLEWA|nr:hypothetical protein NDU88_008089 [Pleurodeles waltl]